MRLIPHFPASELRLAARRAVHFERRNFITFESKELAASE
jgi:hypothetical protein